MIVLFFKIFLIGEIMSVNTFYFEKTKNVIEEIQKSVIGKDEAINKILMAILARGHTFPLQFANAYNRF